MLYKFELENLQTNEKTKYKTMRQISIDLNLDYCQITELFKHCLKPKKYLHPHTKILSEKYKIITNPDIFT
jgi:hypothetical protein